MRHLNDFEKKIIQAMLIREKPDDVCVVNLINKVLPIYVIAWSSDYDVVSFVIHKIFTPREIFKLNSILK